MYTHRKSLGRNISARYLDDVLRRATVRPAHGAVRPEGLEIPQRYAASFETERVRFGPCRYFPTNR